jgi:putative thioredoxin
MPTDVTDLTFEHDVLERSTERPVIVDLWAPWCGPCRTLGPILEKVVEESDGAVELVKINVDENPQSSAVFQVQSIPAVFALRDKKIVDSFIGAVPEANVRSFVAGLVPAGPTEADLLVTQGDEASLRAALDIDPGHEDAVVALAELLVAKGDPDEAGGLLARIPESAATRRIAALARLSSAGEADLVESDDLETRLVALLERVRTDDAARQEYVDILEAMDAEDPRKAQFRKRLSAQLF